MLKSSFPSLSPTLSQRRGLKCNLCHVELIDSPTFFIRIITEKGQILTLIPACGSCYAGNPSITILSEDEDEWVNPYLIPLVKTPPKCRHCDRSVPLVGTAETPKYCFAALKSSAELSVWCSKACMNA